jgi:GTP-binding protein
VESDGIFLAATDQQTPRGLRVIEDITEHRVKIRRKNHHPLAKGPVSVCSHRDKTYRRELQRFGKYWHHAAVDFHRDPCPADHLRQMAEQTHKAIEEADRVLLVVDAREGCTPSDLHVADLVRRSGKSVVVVANKSEGLDPEIASADFHQLGFGEPVPISATHVEGVVTLMERALEGFPLAEPGDGQTGDDGEIRVAVVGRPNVGKSTLINRLLGEERLVTFDEPGTTRDAVHVPFERDGQRYTLIDTAGVRRRARVSEAIEKFSIVKTLQAIEEANVVIAVLDAHDTVAEQDASLLGLIIEQGRALVIAVNKWDGIEQSQRTAIRDGLDLRLDFVTFAPVHFISARHGTGVGDLLGDRKSVV